MRKILIFITLVLLGSSVANGQEESNSKLWQKANDSYSLGDYKEAVALYKEIEERGYVSYKLYYNMANSYYKLQEDGLAILYYSRALKLNPANEDIKTNLEIARLKTLDKIEVIPEFILASWLRRFRNTFSSDAWAMAALVLLAIAALLLLVYKRGDSITARKISFIFSMVLLFFTILAVTFSFTLRNDAVAADSAIVLLPVSNVKSAPNDTGNNLFILHEGTQVEILESVGQWSRIELQDGRQGWMLSSDFEVI